MSHPLGIPSTLSGQITLNTQPYSLQNGLSARDLGRYLHALKQYHQTFPLYQQQRVQIEEICQIEYLPQIAKYCTSQDLYTHLQEVLTLLDSLRDTYAEFNEQITSLHTGSDFAEHFYTLLELGTTLEIGFHELYQKFVQVYAHYLVCTGLCCLHLNYEADWQVILKSIAAFPVCRPKVYNYLYRIMATQPEQRCDAFRFQSILTLDTSPSL